MLEERSLIIDLSRGKSVTDTNRARLEQVNPGIVVGLSSEGLNVSDYCFVVNSMENFYFCGEPTVFGEGLLCGDSDDFPNLKYSTFNEGLQALVDRLMEANRGLELPVHVSHRQDYRLKSIDYDVGVKSALEAYARVSRILDIIQGSGMISLQERFEQIKILSGDINFNSINQGQIKDLRKETKVRLLELGTHYWRVLRGLEKSISATGKDITNVLREYSAEVV